MNARSEITAVQDLTSPPLRRAASWTELLPGLLLVTDAMVIGSAAFAAYVALVEASSYVAEFYLFATSFVLLATVLLLRSGGMYQTRATLSVWRFADTVLVSVATAFVFLSAILHALKTWSLFQADWLIAFGGGTMVGLLLVRVIIGAYLSSQLRRGKIGRRTAVLGTTAHAQWFLSRLNETQYRLTAVTAIYDPTTRLVGGLAAGRPVTGDLYDLVQCARQQAFDDIVIALPDSEANIRAEAIERLRELPVDVYLAPQLSEFGMRLRPVQNQDSLPMFEVWQRPISGWSRFLKLAEDYLLASTVLILLTPVLLCIGTAIRLDSKGPVLFRQKRLGFNNEVFEIFKFRTMHPNDTNETRVVQATRHDARVTRVGRFLRRTSLDELPQLLNVLNGTMSLVGPRPHALSHNVDFSHSVRGYFGRHKVKPGITGWAQVNGLRGEIDSQDKLEARIAHDVHYAENWTLIFDLRILFFTAFVVLFQRNAY